MMLMAKAHPTEDLERVEFGLSVNVGDIGKVALGYMDDKYVLDDAMSEDDDSDDTSWRVKTTSVAGEVSVAGVTAYVGSQKRKSDRRCRRRHQQ